MSAPRQFNHQADAQRVLDDRGYVGTTIHGGNPTHLLEKPIRERIVDSYFWKEQCFGVNEASILDRAVEMSFIGSTYGQQRPSPFICLTFKLLTLLPSREIVLFYLHQKQFKYLTALAAFYVRLTFESVEVYRTLEPLLKDFRKLKRRNREGGYTLTYMDQFVDDLLVKDRVCGTALWKLRSRTDLEDEEKLVERESELRAELEEDSEEEEEETRMIANGHAEVKSEADDNEDD